MLYLDDCIFSVYLIGYYRCAFMEKQSQCFSSKSPIFCFNLQDGENLTREQLEEDIKKLKEAHAEDEGTFLAICSLIS